MSYTNDLQVVVYGERAAVLAEAERWKERAGLSDTEKDDIIIELARDGRLASHRQPPTLVDGAEETTEGPPSERDQSA